jgi:ketosteroid isomerase-like protein
MSTDTASQTEAVLGHHLESFGAKDVNGIMEDFAEDSVLVTPDASFEGLTAIRGFFDAFMPAVTPELLANYVMDRQVVHGELAYIVWNSGSTIPLGTDTFIVRNGKIKYQTFAAYMGS